MNAHTDTFLIYSVEDRLNASVCHGEEEARDIITNFAPAPVRVLRVTEGEICRDVTADFIADEPASIYRGFDPDRDHDDRKAA
jgi:hypothetical protein